MKQNKKNVSSAYRIACDEELPTLRKNKCQYFFSETNEYLESSRESINHLSIIEVHDVSCVCHHTEYDQSVGGKFRFLFITTNLCILPIKHTQYNVSLTMTNDKAPRTFTPG